MKYIRTYEKYSLSEIEEFLENYNKSKKRYILKDWIWYANNYGIPEIFHEEFFILYFLYKHIEIWKSGYTKEDNRVKDCVKEYVNDLIINKFQENPNSYFELKNVIDKTGNFDPRSLNNISNKYLKYVFLALLSALKKAPDWIKNSEKYNL